MFLRKLQYSKRAKTLRTSPSKPVFNFNGIKRNYSAESSFTGNLQLFQPSDAPRIPTYQVMDNEGVILYPSEEPKLTEEELVKMYSTMVKVNTMDDILYNIQRQGRISFYMTSFGEEATHIGSAKALNLNDTLFLQYREQGVLLWRGFTIEHCVNQCFGNSEDLGKGRQMPVHYGSKELNVQTISSPLATQIPQAVGSAYAQRHLGMNNSCTAVYFGEGAASEGDFHAGMNFAATLGAPVLFFCRNNKFAISTPSSEQFKGDGIASRAIGYGMNYVRVDGNDIFAVYNATRAAKALAVEKKVPVLIEAMTYRVSHHSTSDDSTRYRSTDEINEWTTNNNPILRMKKYLLAKGIWDDEKQKVLESAAKKEVLTSLGRAESKKKPSITELFNDVYDTIPDHLKEQQQQLEAHLKKYGKHYPVEDHV